MTLCIFKETPHRLPRRRLNRLFEMITEEEADPDAEAEIHLVIVGDRAMAGLNRRFRGKTGPTDVLSFNLDDQTDPDATFGEIYISAHTAERQARSCRTTLSAEFERLFCHGLLHLFGYDHTGTKDTARMQRREEYFLAQVQTGAR
jgi:rRNA maturation RNase YbeY